MWVRALRQKRSKPSREGGGAGADDVEGVGGGLLGGLGGGGFGHGHEDGDLRDVLVRGQGTEHVVGRDRDGVELHAPAGREPLAEGVGVVVDPHAVPGGIDDDRKWFAGFGPARPIR